MRCPACGAKSKKVKDRPGLRRCVNVNRCGGFFDEQEAATGTVEGGTYDTRRPDKRAQMMESGGPGGVPLVTRRPLRGGLGT